MDWTGNVINILAAIGILNVGIWLSGRARRLIRHLGVKHPQLDITFFSFLGSLARWAIIALTTIVVLGQFGVETTSLIALIGAAGLPVGLALKGTLPNLAASDYWALRFRILQTAKETFGERVIEILFSTTTSVRRQVG